MATAGIIASIWCAIIDYIEGWLTLLLTVLYGVAIAIFVIDCKTTCELVASYNRYLEQASSIPNALEDVVNIVNSLNEDDTEEEEQ